MGDLSRLKGTQSNSLCSGFGTKNLSWGVFDSFFHWYLCRNRYKMCWVWKYCENYIQKNTTFPNLCDIIYSCSKTAFFRGYVPFKITLNIIVWNFNLKKRSQLTIVLNFISSSFQSIFIDMLYFIVMVITLNLNCQLKN